MKFSLYPRHAERTMGVYETLDLLGITRLSLYRLAERGILKPCARVSSRNWRKYKEGDILRVRLEMIRAFEEKDSAKQEG